jgi:aquaporin Z
MQKYIAEIFGTFCLVLLGCGSAVLAGSHIGIVGISLTFGLTLLSLAYLLGPISGCHLNPAVTLALTFSKKITTKETIPYIISQIVGAIIGGYLLLHIAEGKAGFSISHGFACNGFDGHSPEGYSMVSCLITEVVMTLVLLMAVLATTKKNFPSGFAGLFVGLTLTTVHLVSIPVTNTSVNLARSIGVAAVHGGWALEQLWLFAVAQLIAVALAGILSNLLDHKH